MKQLLVILIVFLCLAQPTMAQDQDQRKKVAVVLSGGGAKGMAHIGVLKVIERAGIPVDIVTGTSMGSIIGGLYACGYRAEKLDSIVMAQDWGYVLSDKDDLSHQSLREREKQNTYAISMSVNLGKKSADLGGGFILGKNINMLFNALTAPYNDSIDFNKLPIPFACVATNIIDNTEYDFHSGVLSVAMRASMAIPGVFSPVRMGNMVLVDGGLRNNFPADIAREMGADYIIGVTVQGKEKEAGDIGSTAAVLTQIIDVNCKNKYDDNLAITDIPIRVNTTGYGPGSFNLTAIDTLIRRGEEAAMAHWDELLELREKVGGTTVVAPKNGKPITGQRILISRKPLVRSAMHRIGKLEFVNMSETDAQFIRSKFRLREGDSIDHNKASLVATSIRLDLFYKSAVFRIEPNAVPNADGSSDAKVTFTAGDKKTNEVNVGVRFDNEEMVALQANAAFPLRSKLPMELDFTLQLGKRIMGRIDWAFHPKSFISPSVSYIYRDNDINFYEYGERSYNITYHQYTVQVAPFNFNVRNFNVNIATAWDYFRQRDFLVDRLTEHQVSNPDNEHFFSYFVNIYYNSEDEWFFPRRGAQFRAKFTYYTDNFVGIDGKAGIRVFDAMWRMSFRNGKYLTIQPMLYGRMLFGRAPSFYISNTVGGEWFGNYVEQQLPFAGIRHIEQAWDKMVAAQLQAQVNLTQNNIIMLRLAAGQNADELKDLLDYRTMLGTSLSYYYNTMLGPLGATVGYSNTTKKLSGYINLGFVF